ncbi:MAG TPA: DUF3352 domain-containing protein [Solirubrobacteraceae bacterium]|nr:DUF3352 domain-containing protein [Solirubrobacteraceae bacterium]
MRSTALTATARTALSMTLAGVVALLAATLGGCGSSPSGTSASPATVTPASAPLYIDAVVKPEGSLKTDATATATALTGRQHPFEGLLKLLAGPTGKAPSYAKEVEPWLGAHAGAFLSAVALEHAEGLLGSETLEKLLSEGFSGLEAALLGPNSLQAALGTSSAQGALVLDTTDVDKAKSFLEGQAHSAGAHTTSYRGVTYQVSPDGVAEGIVHKFAVIGSEAGIKSVIETAAGGSSLAQASAYSKLTSTAEHGALANAYLSPEELASALKSNSKGANGSSSGKTNSAESILPLLEGLLGNPGQLYISAIPSSNQVALNLDTLPPSSSAGGASGSGESPSSSTGSDSGHSEALGASGAQVLRGLPGSSWLAVGIGDLGSALGHGAQGLGALGSLGSALNIDGIDFGKLLAPLTSRSLNVQRDLLSWAGATGLYVSGSSVLDLQAALVIASKDPARSRAAVAQLAQAYREVGGQTSPTSVPGTETAVTVKLPSFPLQLTLAAGQGKFVAGLGTASIKEALNPQSTLGSAPSYGAAASTLGGGIEPSALIEFHTLSGLLESLGLNQAPGFSGVASAIAPLGTVTAGGGQSLSDGVKRARLVIGLSSSSGESGASG